MVAVLAGFLIAAAIAITGVGAGVITAPVLILWLGLPPEVAVGTALAFGMVVKVPALATYVRRKQVSWPVARAMVFWGVPGVVLGGLALQWLSGRNLRGAVLLAVGVVVVAGAVVGLYRAWRPAAREVNDNEVDTAQVPPLVGRLSFPIGVEVGFSSAGAGALGTLLLLHRTRLPAAKVVGTDLAFGLALAAVGGSLHIGFGSWDPGLLAKMCAGGIIGAVIGARVAVWVPTKPLRLALLTWLVFLGGHMSYKGVHEVSAMTRDVAPSNGVRPGPR